MSKYDIKKIPSLPSDEEINKHKNFDKVMKKAALYEYKQATKPIYKNVKVLSAVAVAVAVGLIILVESIEETNTPKENPTKTDTLQIQKEIPSVDTAAPIIHKPSPALQQTGASSQQPENTVSESEHITTQAAAVDEMQKNTAANFPGGDEALKNYLIKNIKYPYNAVESAYTGKVEVDLTIDKTGEISNSIIHNSPNAAITNEIKRVIKNMPKWQAAVKNNQPAVSNVKVYFPFTYIGE